MTISVLIPTYNCGPWLRESVDSILAQTYRDVEVVVVDDGSTDDTPQILASYGRAITVVPGAHNGLSAARSLCLRHARGDWVAFHDADDVAMPDRLAFLREYLQRTPAFDAVFGNGERMDGAGSVVPSEIARRMAGRRLRARELFDGFPVYYQASLVPRRAFEAAGSFDDRFSVQTDLAYAYRLVRHCRATFVDHAVFRYRWHTSNISHDRLRGREDIVGLLEGLDEATVREIGPARVRARIARHHAGVARGLLARGDLDGARAAVARALALRPLDVAARAVQWRIFRAGAAQTRS